MCLFNQRNLIKFLLFVLMIGFSGQIYSYAYGYEIKKSDIVSMYLSSDKYLKEYSVKDVVWGNQIRSSKNYLVGLKKELGINYISANIPLIQESGKFLFCHGLENEKCINEYFKYYQSNKNNIDFLKDEFFLENSAVSADGEISYVPWIFKNRNKIIPIGTLHSPDLLLWYKNKIDQAARLGFDGIQVDEVLGSAITALGNGLGDYSQWSIKDFENRGNTFSKDNKGDFFKYQLESAAFLVKKLVEYAHKKGLVVSGNIDPAHWEKFSLIGGFDFLCSEVSTFKNSGGINDNYFYSLKLGQSFGKDIVVTAKGNEWSNFSEQPREHDLAYAYALAYALGEKMVVPIEVWISRPRNGSFHYSYESSLLISITEWIQNHQKLFDNSVPFFDSALLIPWSEYKANDQELIKVVNKLNELGFQIRVFIEGGDDFEVAEFSRFKTIYVYKPGEFTRNGLGLVQSVKSGKPLFIDGVGSFQKMKYSNGLMISHSNPDVAYYLRKSVDGGEYFLHNISGNFSQNYSDDINLNFGVTGFCQKIEYVQYSGFNLNQDHQDVNVPFSQEGCQLIIKYNNLSPWGIFTIKF